MIFNLSGFETLDEKLPAFSYSGDSRLIDDGKLNGKQQWRIKFLTSGKLKFTRVVSSLDIFLVGGGGGAAMGGGGGGYTHTQRAIPVQVGVEYDIVIGDGGAGANMVEASRGGTTTAFGYSAAGGYGGGPNGDARAGGNGCGGGGAGTSSSYTKYGGNGGANGGDGGSTQLQEDSPINHGGSGMGTGKNYGREFWEASTDSSKMYGGGGGGSGEWGPGTGGDGVGGRGAKARSYEILEPSTAGAINTGGGGGGAYNVTGSRGGSGIVVIRNAR